MTAIASEVLPRFETHPQLNDALSRFVREQFDGSIEPLSILEAGCGNRWALDLGKLKYRLTGIDIDAEGLELRQAKEQDLDRAILADLCTVELEPEQFDIVYCSYVLEHVDGAETALDNFVRWLKPGGYMLLKFPDRDSVFGFLTRMLPFRLHVLYKKYLYGLPKAGQPGYGPFPTVYDHVVSRRGMRAFCENRGLEILEEYGTNFYLNHLGVLRLPTIGMLNLIQALSFQQLRADHNNLVYIIRKPARTLGES